MFTDPEVTYTSEVNEGRSTQLLPRYQSTLSTVVLGLPLPYWCGTVPFIITEILTALNLTFQIAKCTEIKTLCSN